MIDRWNRLKQVTECAGRCAGSRGSRRTKKQTNCRPKLQVRRCAGNFEKFSSFPMKGLQALLYAVFELEEISLSSRRTGA